MHSLLSALQSCSKSTTPRSEQTYSSQQGKLLCVLIYDAVIVTSLLQYLMCCSDLQVTHSSSRRYPVHNQANSLARSCTYKTFSGNIHLHLYKLFTYYRNIIKAKKVCRHSNKKEVWGEAFTAFNLSCPCFSSNQELVSRGPAGVRARIGFDRVYCLCQAVDF